MQNKDKFLKFKSIGIVSVALAMGIGAGVLMNQSDIEQDKNAKQVQICENYIKNTLEKINAPSIVDPSYLNTAEGLKISSRERVKKAELSSLSPEKVNCNMEDMRKKFIEDVKKVNENNSKRTSFGTTFG